MPAGVSLEKGQQAFKTRQVDLIIPKKEIKMTHYQNSKLWLSFFQHEIQFNENTSFDSQSQITSVEFHYWLFQYPHWLSFFLLLSLFPLQTGLLIVDRQNTSFLPACSFPTNLLSFQLHVLWCQETWGSHGENVKRRWCQRMYVYIVVYQTFVVAESSFSLSLPMR